MGIKGIYREIGPGKRISLTKLAVQKLEESGRPLRIAIDISIWQFQAQAARGGSNPAIRTLFYRLLRLVGLAIQPIFVFDGPNKPTFKRNKRSGRGDGVATAMAKRLIRLFGFVIHDAPGEAEAECALLQQSGIVDAVLSEDVDTIMFGCTRTLRNWSSEGSNKTPTHVSMYDTQELNEGASGLDREGMVLVALMSGGDYLPEGIPGAGVKLACEAARAGFGKSLCQLKRSNRSELASWKERLTYELRHNESGFFRTRHKALNIPEDFPNMEILRYYTHPVVSPATTMEKLRQQSWDRQIDIQGLREFVRETFDWNYRTGAIKFIRVLAPCLLVRNMIQRNPKNDQFNDTNVIENDAPVLVKSITSRRAHFSTDATPELRISFIPTSIVGYDFQEEPDEVIDFGRDGLALNSDDELEDLTQEVGDESSAAKSSARKPFSPTEVDLSWIPETIARAGIPSMVEAWEQAQRAKAVARSKPKATRQKTKAGGTAAGSLDKFVKVTKNNVPQMTGTKKTTPSAPTLSSPPVRVRTPLDVLPASSQTSPQMPFSSQCSQKTQPSKASKPPTTRSSRSKRNPPRELKVDTNINPWTIASSQGSPRITKHKASSTKGPETILIPSSPPPSPPEGLHPPIENGRDSYSQHEPDPFTVQPASPRKRRSLTPPRLTIDGVDVTGRKIVRDLSPTPISTEKPQRKLARTGSLPLDASPHRPAKQTREFTRAQTVAVETIPLDSDSESDDDEDDDDFELPPLSSLISKTPKGKGVMQTHIVSCPSTQILELEPSPKTRERNEISEKKQTTLKQSFNGVRMTKLYVPRKSAVGFFKEVDVSVEEADALKEKYAAAAAAGGSGRGRRVNVWRRSDVSCVDLTGED